MATYQEQIEKYKMINEQKHSAEASLNRVSSCLIDRLLPFEQRGELKITTDLLVEIIHAISDAVAKEKP